MDKRIITTVNAPSPIGPYSQAVVSKGLLYVSGQIPIDISTGELITTGIRDQTDKVMHHISAILKEAGINFDNVVKCSIFVIDMNDFKVINEVYAHYFGDNPPARETIAVSGLPKNASVEISCIATLE